MAAFSPMLRDRGIGETPFHAHLAALNEKVSRLIQPQIANTAITVRVVHDEDRNFSNFRMSVHFHPVIECLPGCRLEWCDCTGVNSFRREDHRKENYRKVPRYNI